MSVHSVFLFVLTCFGIAVALGLLGLIYMAFLITRGA